MAVEHLRFGMPDRILECVGDLPPGDRNRVIRRADVLGLSFSDAGFVIERVLKRQRERADRPVHLLLREPQDRARVDATTEIRSDLDVGDQSLPHGVAQSLAEFVDDLGLASRVRPHLLSGRDLPIPIRIDANIAISGDRIATRRHGTDPGELGFLVRSAHTSGSALEVPRRRHTQRQQCFDLRREEHVAVHHCVVEGLDPEAIAYRKHRPLAFVGNDHRELTPQERRGLHAALPIEVQRDFAVALGGEAIALRSQTLAKLAVSVELAVHHHVYRAIGAGHGLTAVPQTDDRQPRVSERPLPITRRPGAGAVRPAMLQELERQIAPITGKAVTRHRGENSTHRCVLRPHPHWQVWFSS